MDDGKILCTPKHYCYFSAPKFLKSPKASRANYIEFYHYDGSAESRFLATREGFKENGRIYEQQLYDVGLWNDTKKKFHSKRTSKRSSLS